jgi:hypothetical protein
MGAPPHADDAMPPDHCASCGARLSGPWCAACGEKRREPGDLRLAHLFGSAIAALTNADGRLWGSLRALVLQPGVLTADWVAGRRRRRLEPVVLFLLCNAVFFLLQPVIGWNTLTTDWESHLSGQLYSEWAREWFLPLMPREMEALEAYVVAFNAHASTHANGLVIVMAPLFALASWLLFVPQRREFSVHLVFALHFVAFWLLWMTASLGVVTGVRRGFGWAAADATLDDVTTLATLAVAATWLAFGARRVFGGRHAALRGVLLALAIIPVLLVYRMFLFLVAFATT